MSTPGGFDPRSDPTAPAYETPAYGTPAYGTPTYGTPTYGAPTYDTPSQETPSLEKASDDDPASAWPPPEPADTSGSGWYVAPPPASTLPPGPGQSSPPPPAYPPGYSGPVGPVGPGRKSRGAGLAVALGAVVLLVLAAAGVGIFYLTRGDDSPVAAPPRSSASATASSGSSPSGGTPTGSTTGATTPPGSDSPTGTAEVTVPAVTPGFQGVLSPKENVAYDVPSGWAVQTPGTLVGFEDGSGNPVAIMHGVSTYLDGVCPDVSGSYRGNAGFQTSSSADPAQAAQSGVQTFAGAAALNDDGTTAPVTPGPLQDVAVAQGTITAKMATATVTPPAGAPCGAPTILFTAVAFTTPGGGTAVFMMYLDQGTSDALAPQLAQQIVASLRPYTG